MLKAVIYDMDGVIVDTEPLHCEVNKLLMENLGITFEKEYYDTFIGSTNTHMWTCIIEKYKLDYSVSDMIKMSSDIKAKLVEERGYPAIPYAYDAIKNLHQSGLKLAVASSSMMKDIEKVVDYFEIRNCFDKLITGENVKNPKPAPDVFLLAAEELGVKPSECIVIEDSMHGVNAAKAAAMVCVGFINPGSGNQDLSKADYLITSHEAIDRKFLEMVYAHSAQEP